MYVLQFDCWKNPVKSSCGIFMLLFYAILWKLGITSNHTTIDSYNDEHADIAPLNTYQV